MKGNHRVTSRCVGWVLSPGVGGWDRTGTSAKKSSESARYGTAAGVWGLMTQPVRHAQGQENWDATGEAEQGFKTP